MKLMLISDIHQEWNEKIDHNLFDRMPQADVAVLAGDICSIRQLPDVIARMEAKYAETVYVSGNHEYYSHTILTGMAKISNIVKDHPRFHWLNEGPVTIGGQRFIGHTMWFREEPFSHSRSHMLTDFRAIDLFTPRVYLENAEAQKMLDTLVTAEDVVVTHHLPSYQSVPEMFRTDRLNCFYVCDQEKLILERQPKLWLHGHTHSACDYMIDKTRVVCNPRGYPMVSGDSSDNDTDGIIIEVL